MPGAARVPRWFCISHATTPLGADELLTAAATCLPRTTGITLLHLSVVRQAATIAQPTSAAKMADVWRFFFHTVRAVRLARCTPFYAALH